MIITTHYKIRGWNTEKEGWFSFLKRLVKECGKRTSEALSPAWVKNQIQVFILKKGGPEKLHGKVLDPITKALQSSGLSDAFYQNTNIEIVMQIAKDQILSIKKIDKKKIEVQFQFNSNSCQTSYRVDFENSESGFGDIVSTNISRHYGGLSGGGFGGGNWLHFPERMFQQIVDLILQKPTVDNVKILGVLTG